MVSTERALMLTYKTKLSKIELLEKEHSVTVHHKSVKVLATEGKRDKGP